LDASNQFDTNDLRRAQTKAVLANLYALQGELKLANTLYEESRAIFQANGEAGESSLAFVLDGLGEVRLEEAHWMEAEQLLQQSKALHTELDGESSPLTMTVVSHLGELYACTGGIARRKTCLSRRLQSFVKASTRARWRQRWRAWDEFI
jgi:hypothetical protein